MKDGLLKIATCQFAVGSSIKSNSRQIQSYIRRSARCGADIVHFPECALCGYVGTDFASFEGFDWGLLETEAGKITAVAAQVGVWVVLGSVHKSGKPERLRNSLLLIDSGGKIADRYDKRFCIRGELRRFIPGDRFVEFTINGVKCSLLICFEVRFCEIYRYLYKKGVNCIFQSFYNARQQGPSVHTHIMRQSVQCRAACNHFWISMCNASGYYSPYPSCFIQPDGKIVKQLRFNRAGMMINTVDLSQRFYDPSADYRDMAIRGRFDNKPENQ